jgi:uncharacterized protein (TIGR02118 family)
MPPEPFLLVRARIAPERLDEFRRWHASVHVPHVLRIPGITRAYRLDPGPGTAEQGPNHLALFTFADEQAVQRALNSPEAERARRDWEAWAADVRDLAIQIYATLDSRTLLRHLN